MAWSAWGERAGRKGEELALFLSRVLTKLSPTPASCGQGPGQHLSHSHALEKYWDSEDLGLRPNSNLPGVILGKLFNPLSIPGNLNEIMHTLQSVKGNLNVKDRYVTRGTASVFL